MVDPISVGSISVERTAQTKEARHVVTSEDFESVRLKAAELDSHVERLKEDGLVTSDQIKLASREAQEMFNRYIQPGGEAYGFSSLFHDNRAKLESLREELSKVGSSEKAAQVTDYLHGLDKEFASLETILNNIDVNAPINPMDMIRLQTKMEFVTEHIEILSKVVEQVSSGMKTILQTNV
ncbi:MAG: hypothetical protein RMM17_04310 [Acidobacteriota bacterium]|nr:hypothetical protein [Blastocatellia bacterium]MDW8411885.1 hypothetical protein [Acidobacteriota bacterium]